MSRKKNNSEDSGESFEDFVPAIFTRSMEEAEQYRELLNDHDIPAIVGADEDAPDEPEEEAPTKGKRGKKSVRRGGMSRGIPILVPEAMLDEASEIIADRDDLDEFKLTSAEDGDEDDDEEDEDETEGFEELDEEGLELVEEDDEEEEEDEEEEGEDLFEDSDDEEEELDEEEP